jgi:hypothetical protein
MEWEASNRPTVRRLRLHMRKVEQPPVPAIYLVYDNGLYHSLVSGRTTRVKFYDKSLVVVSLIETAARTCCWDKSIRGLSLRSLKPLFFCGDSGDRGHFARNIISTPLLCCRNQKSWESIGLT